MKQIRSRFLRSIIFSLLALTGLAGLSFSFSMPETIEAELEISFEFASADDEGLLFPNDLDEGDDENGDGDNFFHPLTHLFNPLSANKEKNTVLPQQHSFIALYLLHHSLIFYHPVA